MAIADSKPHYDILDGLRGVAALVVVVFHIFEAFATSQFDQVVNHGYLAVDFFFILSGFVVGYAYDSRWGKMTVREFFKRRIIRLHPMVIMGSVVGAALFWLSDSVAWNTAAVGFGALALATLLNALLIPVTPEVEIRGIGEMYPLNGPSWSLFFEYIGNILYALIIRRLPTRALAVLVFVAGCGLASLAFFGPTGGLGHGWQLTGFQFSAGFARLFFSFSAGLLLSRIFKPTVGVKGAFWICSAVLVALLAMPRVGGEAHSWMNATYEIVCCAILFPMLVWLGASEASSGSGGFTKSLYGFLGKLSYPLYMVHYPLIYVYYGWVKDNELTFGQSLPGAVALVVGSVVLAWLSLKLYDIPVRKYLTAKWQKRS
jgi:peptidoglycan/LPS O-acetylase OafA/YrhL